MDEAGFGVYVHWPFCLAKCPYCDFNSHVVRQVDEEAWMKALTGAIRAEAERLPGRVVSSVFFGGGTPSLMPPSLVEAIIDTIAGVWALPEGAEVTLEANPTSSEAGRFAAYRWAGINRLSMGVQALNDADLRALGRMHSAAEARAAFAVAREVFERVSFDLIYARPGQSLAAWRRELEEVLAMAADHVSLYQLTIEEGTRFADLYRRGRLDMPEDEHAAALYEVTQETAEQAGLPAYEISNHARVGAECRHNLLYWRYGEYVGIGPGAHGRLLLEGQRVATETERLPHVWLGRAEENRTGIIHQKVITPEDQGAEYLMMALRLSEGASLTRYARLAGGDLPEQGLRAAVEAGLLKQEQSQVTATAKGRLLLNRLLEMLLV